MKDYQRGQILLIVVLVMVVALTVGLSVATRTITNLRTSTDQENSSRAFSAAEAGIEQALSNKNAISGAFTNNTSYTTTVSTLAGANVLLNNGLSISKDNPVDVWLSTYPTYTNPYTGNFTIFWGADSDVCNSSESSNSLAALEIVLLTGTKVNPVLTRYAFDPCQARSNNNSFTYVPASSGTVSGKSFTYRRSFVITSGLFMRIIPLYSPTIIGVKGCDAASANCTALPSQGTIIESVGTADTAKRKIVHFSGNAGLPAEVFPYVLFSPK
jgi:Tfp pilus assembly protein PilX